MADIPNPEPTDASAGIGGDGDLFDPDVHGMEDDEASTGPSTETPRWRPADGSGGQAGNQPTGSDPTDGPEDDDEFGIDAGRASEIDDVTDGMSRDDIEAALADAVDSIDYSNVDVGATLAERDEYKSLAQRVQADFDNFRKQAGARAQNDADRATGRLAEAMLPVLDAAEAAFLRHPDEVGPLLNQMLIELKKHGLETLDLDGQPFDPEVAEAVAHEPSEGGDAVISEVLRSGYRWKGKTLRPAMVKTTD